LEELGRVGVLVGVQALGQLQVDLSEGLGAGVVGQAIGLEVVGRLGEAVAQLEQALLAAGGGSKLDLVVSDMAPNLSGIDSADAARMAHLVELAVDFAVRHLKPGGSLVAKVFHGASYDESARLFQHHFKLVKKIKPKASRPQSAENFLVGLGLKSQA
jgi:23S rRNA (uridine2552-2'-O)-methyltransferase